MNVHVIRYIRYNDGRRLRVLRLFGSERDVTGEWRKLQYEELYSVMDDRLIEWYALAFV